MDASFDKSNVIVQTSPMNHRKFKPPSRIT